MADPQCDEPNGIDLLIGSELFWEILCQDQIKIIYNLLILHKTKLGWIVAGRINQMVESKKPNKHFTGLSTLDKQAIKKN